MGSVKRRGAVLIAALLLSTLLMVLGMAYLGRRSDQMKGYFRAQESERALQLALAGLETVRVKLDRDPDYPPVQELGRKVFAYSEPVLDLDGVTRLGSYEVTLDGHYLIAPYQVLRVRVLGSLEVDGAVSARRVVLAEFDLAEKLRSNSTLPNPRLMDLINFQDMGSL